jgi:HTH-type transcriptional regulator / antitoxin HipB
MKYTEFKNSLRKDDPEFDSRIKAEKLRVDIAVAIAQKREMEGYSQKVIANIAHLTQQQVSRIENGENCNIDTYLKAMAALGMNFKDIAI